VIPVPSQAVVCEEPVHGRVAVWPDAARILIVAAGAAAVWFRIWEPLPHFSVIGVATLLIGGWLLPALSRHEAADPKIFPNSAGPSPS